MSASPANQKPEREDTRRPAQRPCSTCRHFKAKWCSSIEAEVEPWWTGCIRHKLLTDNNERH